MDNTQAATFHIDIQEDQAPSFADPQAEASAQQQAIQTQGPGHHLAQAATTLTIGWAAAMRATRPRSSKERFRIGGITKTAAAPLFSTLRMRERLGLGSSLPSICPGTRRTGKSAKACKATWRTFFRFLSNCFARLYNSGQARVSLVEARIAPHHFRLAQDNLENIIALRGVQLGVVPAPGKLTLVRAQADQAPPRRGVRALTPPRVNRTADSPQHNPQAAEANADTERSPWRHLRLPRGLATLHHGESAGHTGMKDASLSGTPRSTIRLLGLHLLMTLGNTEF